MSREFTARTPKNFFAHFTRQIVWLRKKRSEHARIAFNFRRTPLGECYPFGRVLDDDDPRRLPFAKVLYLYPRPEELAFGRAVAVVAHELAHIILGHNLRPTLEEYEAPELAAWNWRRNGASGKRRS